VYNASDSNILRVVVLEEVCLQCFLEATRAESRVLKMMGQLVLGHWTGNRECSMTESAAMMSWHNQLISTGRAKMLTTDDRQHLMARYWEAVQR